MPDKSINLGLFKWWMRVCVCVRACVHVAVNDLFSRLCFTVGALVEGESWMLDVDTVRQYMSAVLPLVSFLYIKVVL